MRTGVRAINAANDVPEGSWEGYNETTTHAFLPLFYSPARRRHPQAKTRFIEPDLTPLPR